MQKRYAVQVKWALEQTEAALAPLAAKAMGIAPEGKLKLWRSQSKA